MALLALLAGWVHAGSELGSVQLKDFSLNRGDEGLYLSAQLDITLSATMADALQKGVPLYFVAQATLYKSRWYWRDDVAAQTRRYMRLVYQPLTRRWRLNASASPLVASGLGVSLGQHFDSLDDALHAMGRMAQWLVAPMDAKQSLAEHRVQFEFGIDAKQLPRPFLIGQAGAQDWTLRLTHDAVVPGEGT